VNVKIAVKACIKTNEMNVYSVRKITLIYLLSAVFAVFSSVSYAQDGKALFKSKCASCHKTNKESTGPALMGARDRWSDAGEAEMIYDWVKGSGALINSGTSKRAKEVFGEYKTPMSDFPTLTNADIDAIFDYADTPPVVEVAEVVAEEGAGEEEAEGSVLWLVVLVLILAVVFFAAMGVRKKLAYIKASQNGEEIEGDKSFGEQFGAWFYKNWLFGMTVCIILAFAGMVDGLVRLNDLNLMGGYEPSQPIAFVHDRHAGDMGIDCRYCHNSVEKSKHAGIPTTNVCMNCHRVVHETAKGTGKEEIAKLHVAAGYNVEKKDYNRDEDGKVITGEPIVWNKVHNLPDHVFFSHQQHVKVGGVDCMQCHGDVKTYKLGKVATLEDINELAKTESKVIPLTRPVLTMGWCIECHQETNIDVGPDASNAYYQEIHNRLKLRPDVYSKIRGEEGEISVKELGGWECAKCHY